MEERLQKYLAQRGVASRRSAEQMIAEGRVAVNGQVILTPGQKVNPEKDKVTVDGMLLGKPERRRYILLHKPTGYICTVRDERGRRTVLELLPRMEQRLYPVGRLDYDTSGLLLLTNDGELTQKLLHPSGEINKTYRAEVEGHPAPGALQRLRRGIRLSDGMTAPAQVRLLSSEGDTSRMEIIIHEGRNRQVRRMLEAIGHPVIRLKRTGMAFLTLDKLAVGQWRELTPKEVEQLRQL